jgi:mono/diheme cytochrome c family protein
VPVVVRQRSGWSFVCLELATSLGIELVGCHAAATLTPQEAEVTHLFDVRCAHCHEDSYLALKKAPPDLHGVFRRNTLPSGALANGVEVRRIILTGKGMMPAFTGRFTEEQMAALLA